VASTLIIDPAIMTLPVGFPRDRLALRPSAPFSPPNFEPAAPTANNGEVNGEHQQSKRNHPISDDGQESQYAKQDQQ